MVDETDQGDLTAADYALRSKAFWYPEWQDLLLQYKMYLSQPISIEWTR